MISPLQVLFYFAVTLAPAGSHHVIVSGGDEVYKWDKGDSLDDADTWVYDWAAVNPKAVLANNDIVPANFDSARSKTGKVAQKDQGSYTLLFDPAHELEKTSQGYVYVVRPGSVNEKFYSFTFR
jgi:hypothetical protein